MKKLLSILGLTTLLITPAATLVACGNPKTGGETEDPGENEDKKIKATAFELNLGLAEDSTSIPPQNAFDYIYSIVYKKFIELNEKNDLYGENGRGELLGKFIRDTTLEYLNRPEEAVGSEPAVPAGEGYIKYFDEEALNNGKVIKIEIPISIDENSNVDATGLLGKYFENENFIVTIDYKYLKNSTI